MEIKMCNHCGENYFEEDLNDKGICKLCSSGIERYTTNTNKETE